MENIAAASPAEIDGEWNKISFEIAKHETQIERYGQNMQPTRYYRPSDAELARYAALIEQERAIIEGLHAAEAPFEAEWSKRGGWTRAFIVQNSNGHIHSSTSCKSCYISTRFGWITEMSGHAEAEIIEAAGEMACTWCYPAAPTLPSFSQRCALEMPADREARIAREAEKAASAAKKIEKQILDPGTGRGLAQDIRWPGSPFKTERGAYLAALENAKSSEWYDAHPDEAKWQANIDRIGAAIDAKHGHAAGTTASEIRAKAAKSVAKEKAK